MPSPPTGNPVGHPGYEIDWNKVDYLLEAGCLGTQIAASLGISADTLYNHCMREKGVNFSAYLKEKRAKGDSSLHLKQYEMAMDGNTTMLLWLGKNRLNQKENPEPPSSPNDNSLNDIIVALNAVNLNALKESLDEKCSKKD